VPSAIDAAPPPQYAAAVERARELVRAAVLEENLPGISAAVGAGGTIVWAEGFGWRDVKTQTPVTPRTRFNIGTGASAVTEPTISRLGLTSTGAESAVAWSPEQIGEPGEDFPPLTVLRHTVLQPLGLAPAEYPLPDDRATFYVPRADDSPLRGRRLMYMRDLACCAGKMASYSTASDLVRVGLANGASVNGELAGGTVMSLITMPDRGIVVAVLSNITHAKTSALGLKIGEAFAKQAP
jgi:CubicO group peptidase (beta-lactamase class C family)